MMQNSTTLYDHRKHTLGYYFMRKIILMNSEKSTPLTTVELKGETF